MRYIKYISVIILVFLGLMLPGEIYQSYASTFMSDPHTSFEIQEDISTDVMLGEILDTAKKYNVQMYFLEHSLKDKYYEEINIYCDDDVRKYIEDKYGIIDGTVKSLLSGESRVTFLGWDKLSGESMRDTPSGYYMLLSVEDARKFKMTLIDEYEGGTASVLYDNDKVINTIIISVFWAVIISIIMLINYYEAVKLKKEMMIRVIMGDSLWVRAGKHIFTDMLVYIVIFMAVFCGVKFYACNIFLWEIAVIAGVLLVVLNTLVSGSVLMVDYKRAFADIGADKKVLKVSYIIDVIITIILIFSISGNIIDSGAYFEALSQKELYKKYENYKYIDFRSSKSVISEAWVAYSGYFYQKNISDKDIVAFEWIVEKQDYNIIMANANFKWYLEKHIEEFSQINKEYKNYIFIPEKYKGTELEKKIHRNRMYLSDNTGNTSDMIIYYKENVRIPVQNSYTEHAYTYLKNPVICYTEQTDYLENLEANRYTMMEVTMPRYFVNISDDELLALENELKESDIDILSISVYEVYSYELQIMRRFFIGNLVVSLMLLLMKLLLIFTIVKMEYIANRKEIIIKKILGYSLASRFKKLYNTTLVTGILSVGIVALIVCSRHISYWAFIILVALLILILETAIITIVCIASDRTNIQRTLKNGF